MKIIGSTLIIIITLITMIIGSFPLWVGPYIAVREMMYNDEPYVPPWQYRLDEFEKNVRNSPHSNG